MRAPISQCFSPQMNIRHQWQLKNFYYFFAGPLLEAVQMAAIYPDSKTFVDKKLKLPPGKIIKNFETLLNQHNGSLLSVDEIKKVRSNFNHLD